MRFLFERRFNLMDCACAVGVALCLSDGRYLGAVAVAIVSIVVSCLGEEALWRRNPTFRNRSGD